MCGTLEEDLQRCTSRRMTWPPFFAAGSTLERGSGKKRKTNWHEAISSALNFPCLKEVSQNCFVSDVVNFKNRHGLANCQVQKLRTSCRSTTTTTLHHTTVRELQRTTLQYATLHYTYYNYNCIYHYKYTILHYATLDYTT